MGEANAEEGWKAGSPTVMCPEQLRAVSNSVLEIGLGEREAPCLFMSCPHPTSYRTQAFGFLSESHGR